MTSRNALSANSLPAPERALAPATRIEEYEIERVLATSSLAIVYRAYDHALQLAVAIKELLPETLVLRGAGGRVVPRARMHAERFERARQAFIDEAQTLARYEHAALLRVMRIVHAHGTVYRVMRLCPGPTLLEHRRETAAPPDPATLRRWLDGLLGALAALHDEGRVHGAVSPGNILLSADKGPLLLDFEAVRAALVDAREPGMFAAVEPGFAPLEQRVPLRPTGPWTDLYSLAATLRHCIGGELPAPLLHDAEAPALESLAALWRRQPGAPAPTPELTRLFEALDACMAEESRQRPQSVAELRARLDPPRPGATAPAAPAASLAAASATAAPAAGRLDVEAANARILADLDQTFALIAAQAGQAPAAAGLAAGVPGTEAAVPVPSAGRADRAATGSTAAWPPAVAPEPPPPPTEPRAIDTAAARRWPRVALRSHRGWWLGSLVIVLAMLATALWWPQPPERDTNLAVPNPGVSGEVTTEPAAAPAPSEAVARQAAPLAFAAPSAGKPTLAAAAVTAVEAAPAPAPAPTPRSASPSAKPRAQPPPVKQASARPAAPAAASPRELCGDRTQFSLYRCMQTQCAKPAWSSHAQCQRLRRSDTIE